MRAACLAHLIDPIKVRPSFFALANEYGVRLVTMDEVSRISEPICTFDVGKLLDDFRASKSSPPIKLWDIQQALRLVEGLPKDEGGHTRADVWRHLRLEAQANAPSVHQLEKWSNCSSEWPSPDSIEKTLRSTAGVLRLLCESTEKRLYQANEWNRYHNIELPLQYLWFRRQYDGISVSTSELGALIDSALKAKYAAYKQVASHLKVNPTGLTFWNVQPYLAQTDIAEVDPALDGAKLRERLKLAVGHSSFARSFLDFSAAQTDERTLQWLRESDGRIYPSFDVLGTITGRTLVADPNLQQLRKSFRSAISADEGKRLAYLDFEQFEPGVLAHLSGDQDLIHAYNSTDLYKELSVAAFNSPDARDLAKRIFLSFCYGMTLEGIVSTVLGSQAVKSERERLMTDLNRVFVRFSGLQRFREAQAAMLESEGSVRSAVGNARIKAQKGSLTPYERRWALNHSVQATASVVFKDAVLAIGQKFGHAALLLPMHDAILIQVSNDQSGEADIEECAEIMRQTFVRYCGSIQPRVKVGSFAS